MNVYAKLQQARVKFHSKSLKKTGENKFAGYKYFELGDFLPVVQEVFNEVGLIGTVSFTSDVATLLVIDVEKPEFCIEFKSPMGSAALKGCHEVQNIGAVETYQRRYLWVAAMEIVEHDVLDATTGKDVPAKKAYSKGTITPNTGAGEELNQTQKESLQKLAANVKLHLADGNNMEAVAVLQDSGLDIEEKRYLWTFLESKERTTINSLTKK